MDGGESNVAGVWGVGGGCRTKFRKKSLGIFLSKIHFKKEIDLLYMVNQFSTKVPRQCKGKRKLFQQIVLDPLNVLIGRKTCPLSHTTHTHTKLKWVIHKCKF